MGQWRTNCFRDLNRALPALIFMVHGVQRFGYTVGWKAKAASGPQPTEIVRQQLVSASQRAFRLSEIHGLRADSAR